MANRSVSVPTLQLWLAFGFGVVFLGIIFGLVFMKGTLTEEQYVITRITIALAAGGIGAVIPGLLNVQISQGRTARIRAGGALAVFAVVYFFDPPSLLHRAPGVGRTPDSVRPAPTPQPFQPKVTTRPPSSAGEPANVAATTSTATAPSILLPPPAAITSPFPGPSTPPAIQPSPRAPDLVAVRPSIDGTLREVTAQKHVKQGERIAIIHRPDLDAEIEAASGAVEAEKRLQALLPDALRAREELASAELAAAQTRHQQTTQALAVAKERSTKGLIAQNELDAATLAVRQRADAVTVAEKSLAAVKSEAARDKELAAQRVSEAAGKLGLARAQKQRTEVLSPISGRVVRHMVAGETVSVTAGSEIVVIQRGK